MAKKDLTEIICIIDQSGSMESLTNDTIGGFNRFIGEQKKVPGDALVTLVLFSNTHQTVHEGLNIHSVPALSDETYRPSGGTALLDAIGETIDTVGNRLSKMAEEERPEKVMVIIMTDGEENSSHKFTNSQIKEKVDHQTNTYKWNFLFMGANQDSFAEASKIGVKTSANFLASKIGMRSAYATIDSMTTAYRANP